MKPIANDAALSVTRPDLIELLRSDKPELVEELKTAIVGLLKKASEWYGQPGTA